MPPLRPPSSLNSSFLSVCRDFHSDLIDHFFKLFAAQRDCYDSASPVELIRILFDGLRDSSAIIRLVIFESALDTLSFTSGAQELYVSRIRIRIVTLTLLTDSNKQFC